VVDDELAMLLRNLYSGPKIEFWSDSFGNFMLLSMSVLGKCLEI